MFPARKLAMSIDPQPAAERTPKPVAGPPLQLFSIDANEPRGALAADPPLLPSDELLAELEQAGERLETATPQEILRWLEGLERRDEALPDAHADALVALFFPDSLDQPAAQPSSTTANSRDQRSRSE